MKPQLRLIHCNERTGQNEEGPLEELAMDRTSEEVQEPLPASGSMHTGISKMLPLLIGLTLAAVFGLMEHAVYGTTDVPREPWVYSVIWAMITAGAIVSLLQMSTACLACRVFRRIRITSLEGRVCGECA